MGSFVTDLQAALRRLARSPFFASVAALTLAVGIGLNATIFTFVDAVILRPLPAANPDELVSVYSSWPEEVHATSSRPDWEDLRRSGTDSLFGYSLLVASLQEGGRSELVVGELATGNYFEVLGIPPAHGRMLTLDDDRPAAPRVAVVSWKFFEHRLGGDPSRIGSTIRLNGESYEVVGVAPSSYAGMMPGGRVQLWAPSIRFTELDPVSQIHSERREAELPITERRAYRWMWLKARPRAGTSPQQLQARLGAVMGSLAESHPISHRNVSVRVLPDSAVRIHPDIDGTLEAAALALSGLVGLVLLVACANLANLLLARALSRRREVAVRLAIGAKRFQIMRLFVLEVLIVAAAAGVMALGIAQLASVVLLRNLPPVGIDIDLAVGVDFRIVLFTAGLTLLAALVAA
ncbi:MAG: ABC transporter permease, partial [Holophagales bacterium]|nr:ABC transporter permease [Holophagales bacterium]